MTIFGPDISNWQTGISVPQIAAEGFEFLIGKVTEGDGYVDPTWPGFRDAALDAGMIVAGYHYVRADADIDAQADLFAANLGAGIPAMLDHELDSGGIGTFWAVVNAINARGIEIALSYIPRWYWSGHMGRPDLSAVPGLVASSYVSGDGFASALYPGDTFSGWAPYGGRTPDLLQFTDRALIAGQRIDANAYRGTRADLDALLHPDRKGTADMTPEQAREQHEIWQQLRGPAGDGWPQLGQNAAGENLTLVDAVAKLGDRLDALAAQIEAGA